LISLNEVQQLVQKSSRNDDTIFEWNEDLNTPMHRGLRADEQYDVLVVGGGITGAAIAYEAASRGLSVALVEKDDIGGATSAATGKLIHGGLRYLKNFEIGLVRESLRERRVLCNIAPGLVVPFPIVLPEPGCVEHLGLTFYDLLSFDRNRVNDPSHRIPAHRSMKPAELEAHGLGHVKRAIVYYDCLMPSPERLTLAFVRSAVARGATFLTYARVVELLVSEGRVAGARVEDAVAGATLDVAARMVVNATGPWAHDLLDTSPETRGVAGEAPMVRSEGIYLVTKQLSDLMVLYVSEHGHFSFAPWRGHSLIGPTETPYEGDVDDWRVTRKSVEDFLDHINWTSRLPEPIGIDDVRATYGGLRPLIESSGDDTYDASRASELVDHASEGVDGIVTVIGAKYTTARSLAVKTTDHIAKALGARISVSRSGEIPLDACDIGAVSDAIARARAAWPELSDATITELVRLYGTAHEDLLALTRERPELAAVLDADGEILAQAVYAVRDEAALSLQDVLLRRTGLGTLGDPGDGTFERVAAVVAGELGWSEERTADELAAAKAAVRVPNVSEWTS
jgi:glycerol-3-phosphate dehydrogenase